MNFFLQRKIDFTKHKSCGFTCLLGTLQWFDSMDTSINSICSRTHQALCASSLLSPISSLLCQSPSSHGAQSVLLPLPGEAFPCCSLFNSHSSLGSSCTFPEKSCWSPWPGKMCMYRLSGHLVTFLHSSDQMCLNTGVLNYSIVYSSYLL